MLLLGIVVSLMLLTVRCAVVHDASQGARVVARVLRRTPHAGDAKLAAATLRVVNSLQYGNNLDGCQVTTHTPLQAIALNTGTTAFSGSSGTNDSSQRFFQQAPIRHALGVGALGQIVQLAPHSGQIGRMWKPDQIEVQLLIFNGS